MIIDANTNLYCLIGHPISKSLSPEIHNYSFKKNGINAKYIALDVSTEDLEDAVKGIKALGIRGCNVTIPHKIDIIKYLDEIDEEAELLGAVNTVKNENGKLIGYNTDGRGFVQVLKDKNIEIKNKNIAVLGAGGAARAISIILAKEGINQITIFNRTIEKAKIIIDEIKEKFPDVTGMYSSLESNKYDLSSVDILINCTSIGMYPNIDEMPVDPSIFPRQTVICDIVYKPLKTKLLEMSEKNGNIAIGGLDMLIYQGILSEEIWLQKNIDKDLVIEWIKEKI
ncbi:shikimate 5-dehydrogenase AroE [Gottschalkia acidurici 9a]|uniref:Shikimate dehydrogenase (NADP(+)) n=1 Tax=Gottschalkia acidurici (strain ATCC 7906 / DSM 604 / BCRC 14475 / CIP 104303 / KCTC 5404 / NCIMB 10678 / 9a) TaxID=1128398 RepID=K0B0D3_GOTA9|nr:shikimate dehydrogenase [Gottschalkia acidurici]AFS78375.1 shikimate 5-dehydrogenase AroE [Gottschalkia acidurici 9a]